MITEQYVEFSTAKLLKEKGFDENCMLVFNIDSNGILPCSFGIKNSEIDNKNIVTLPSQSLTMRWLREVHNIDIDIKTDWGINPETGKYFVKCYKYRLHYSDAPNHDINERFDTYEQAAESAIKYCLENLI